MEKLVGRVKEKKTLEGALASNRAELIAIYGRRRVGKTFLVRSVYEKHIAFEFTGLLNGKMGEQLENFGHSMTRATNSPGKLAAPTSWSAAFVMLENFLTPILKKKRVVVFLDEFPWINTRKSNFLRSFDYFWNAWATKQPNLTVVICGSAASWMIQNIVRSVGGLHNRITHLIPLSPFTLKETEDYLKSRMINLDQYQILQLYMVMGGIPHYLSGIKKGESATAAINRLCFTNKGYLITEFNNLYASLFEYSANHIAIVRLLSGTSKGLTRTEIIQSSTISSGGRISTVLEELEESGFISSYIPFGKTSKDAVHRLSDEYSLFYLKYMDGKKSKSSGNWQVISKSASWGSWSGYAFEAICLKHIDQIKNGLGIGSSVVEESIWRHVPGKGQPGTQIDLLIDRNDHTINICEIKFSTSEFTINNKYAAELKQKQDVFIHTTKTKKTVLLTMITTYGLKSNTYSTSLVQNELTMEDLFS